MTTRQVFKTAEINSDRNRDITIRGIGIPFGGVGTGYSVFGRYGFMRENFDSTPDFHPMLYPRDGAEWWSYQENQSRPAPYALTVTRCKQQYVLQENSPEWLSEYLPVTVETRARLPKGFFKFSGTPGLEISMEGFSPLIPHNLQDSNSPVQIYNLMITNTGTEAQEYTVSLRHRYPLVVENGNPRRAIFYHPHGETGFEIIDGIASDTGVSRQLVLSPGETEKVRLLVAWHYPQFKTPSPAAKKNYRRSYSVRYFDVRTVLDTAKDAADRWSTEIDRMHDSFNVPGSFFRLWFGSLASMITGSMLADGGEYFEIESPHAWINTMDVSVYSGWCTMLNFPELEKQDMRQYFAAIPKQGESAGFVWHSLWDDACLYDEEPTFMLRLCRDIYYFRDRKLAEETVPWLKMVMERTLRQCDSDGLYCSSHGNQSYDNWKMPGVSAYVNSAWIYALQAYSMVMELLGLDDELQGISARQRSRSTAKAFDRRLWNEENSCWDCFHCKETSANHPQSLFMEQMFGRWVLATINGVEELLPPGKVKRALTALYHNNLLTRPDFRGWANGMLSGGRIEPNLDSYHAHSCWVGTQLNMGSLSARFGLENQAADVFASVEFSFQNNHLAVGEYNQAAGADGKVGLLEKEPGKDTPRFPPYPRYKVGWEWVAVLLGLTLDWDHLYLHPFHDFDLEFSAINIPGTTLQIKIHAGWTRVMVNGVPGDPEHLILDRDQPYYELLFCK